LKLENYRLGLLQFYTILYVSKSVHIGHLTVRLPNRTATLTLLLTLTITLIWWRSYTVVLPIWRWPLTF